MFDISITTSFAELSSQIQRMTGYILRNIPPGCPLGILGRHKAGEERCDALIRTGGFSIIYDDLDELAKKF